MGASHPDGRRAEPSAVRDRTSIGQRPVPPKIAGRENERVIEISRERFEELVGDALDQIPPDLARLMDNVVVLVEDDPPEGEDLLGLYEGLPLTERGDWYGGVLPDRITLYRKPILAECDTEDDVRDEVYTTVVHEIAHHFGIDDDRLDELGW